MITIRKTAGIECCKNVTRFPYNIYLTVFGWAQMQLFLKKGENLKITVAIKKLQQQKLQVQGKGFVSGK